MAYKILLIDDDADDREFFCEAMEEIAPEVTCEFAEDGRRGLAKLSSHETELPDLIFLDINMPVISGWEYLIKLKEQEEFKDIPVIMYSTSSTETDIPKANTLGALCFFTKPSNFQDLKKSLEIVIENLKNNSLSSITVASPVFAV